MTQIESYWSDVVDVVTYLEPGEIVPTIEDVIQRTSELNVNDMYGAATVMSDDGSVLVVGAYGYGSATLAGRIFIYRFEDNRYVFKQDIAATDVASSDQFGNHVSISADGVIVAVSSPGDDYDTYSTAGSVTIFKYNGTSWVQKTKFKAVANANERFGGNYARGICLSKDGAHIAIGSEDRINGVNVSGQVTVIDDTTGTRDWSGTFTTKINPPVNTTNAGFGHSVALSNNKTVLAVSGKLSAAGVYVYRNPTGYAWETPVLIPVTNLDHVKHEVRISDDGSRIAISRATSGNVFSQVSVFFWNGTTWVEEFTISNTDTIAETYYFGWSIDLSGDGATLAIGYPSDKELAFNNNKYGSVLVYKRTGTTWSLVKKIRSIYFLENKDLTYNATKSFGFNVSLNYDGSKIVVGSTGDGTYSATKAGMVFIYKLYKSTYLGIEKAILSPPAPSNSYAGYSCSLSADGTIAILGAYNESSSYTSTGAIYIFKRTGESWAQIQRICPNDQASLYYGGACSLSSDASVLVVGAYGKTISSQAYRGRAYIYVRSGDVWSQVQVIDSTNAIVSDYFAYSNLVSISGNGAVLVIGSRGPGRIYIYRRSGNTWSLEYNILKAGKLAMSAAINYDGTVVVVGAWGYATPGANAGCLYVLKYTGGAWTTAVETLTPIGVASGLQVGMAVAISDDGLTIATTAKGDVTYGNGIGAIHVFSNVTGTWTYVTKLYPKGNFITGRVENVALSRDGKTIAVGAEASSVPGIFIYNLINGAWRQVKHQMNSDWVTGDNFGKFMAFNTDGTMLLATSPSATSAKGKAYIFN